MIGAIAATNYLTDPGSILDVTKLSFEGSVSGADQAGGIIGRIAATNGGTVSASELLSNAVVTAAATTGYRMAGGIVGSATTDTFGTGPGPIDIASVASFGTVSTTARGGGILGYANATTGNVGIFRGISVSKVTSSSTAGGVVGCTGSGGGGSSLVAEQIYALGTVSGLAMTTGGFLGYSGGGTVAASSVYYSPTDTGQSEDVPFIDDPNVTQTTLATLACAPSADVGCTNGSTVMKNFDENWNFGTSADLPGLTIRGALARPEKSGNAFVIAQ